MNRQDLQNLSRMRVRDAKVLLDAGNYPGSYYLMGYAVECAIKSAIAKQTRRYDFPDKKLANDSFSHDLKGLMQTAGLWTNFEAAMSNAPNLGLNWMLIKDWNETARYEVNRSEMQARAIYSACIDRTYGVLPWLKEYW